MEMLSEVQAHGAPIERMRLSYGNDWLFTAGKDCCLMIHEVKDRDPRGGLVKRDRDQSMLPYSDEILTEKSEMDDILGECERLKNDLAAAKDPSHSGVNEKSNASEQEEKIKKLHEQLSSQQLQIRSRIEQLEASKNELEEQFEKQLKLQAEENHQELEARRNEYSQRMLEDAARYQTLQEQQ